MNLMTKIDHYQQITLFQIILSGLYSKGRPGGAQTNESVPG